VAVGAAGALICYLKQQLLPKVDHLAALLGDARDDYVVLDAATQVNLELVESRGARNMSLLAALDRTVTPMGGRKLRSWILQPLRAPHELACRQQIGSGQQIGDQLQAAFQLVASTQLLQNATPQFPSANRRDRAIYPLE